MNRRSGPSPDCRPGVPTYAICTCSPSSTLDCAPRIRWRVVWGFGDTATSRTPSARFRRVDLPTLGRPTMAQKPARMAASRIPEETEYEYEYEDRERSTEHRLELVDRQQGQRI